MTFTFHWWWISILLFFIGIGVLAFTRMEGVNFPMPSLHLHIGLLILFTDLVFTITRLLV